MNIITQKFTEAYLAFLGGLSVLFTTLTGPREYSLSRSAQSPRAARAATFIEYAILALIVILVGAGILVILRTFFTGAFSKITGLFNSTN